MRTLFLFGVISGCNGIWGMADTGLANQDSELPYNLCEDLLDEVGYPVLRQDTLEDPSEFTILYNEEPEERPCGGIVVDTGGGEIWLVGMIEFGDRLTLLVPLKPPTQVEVVTWGMEDVPSDPNDFADENGFFWAGTDTRAQSGKFSQGGVSTVWERQDLRNEEGVVTAYLVDP